MKKRQLVACIMRPCAYYYKNLYQERVPPPEHWSNYEIFILAVISRPCPILSDVKLASFLVKHLYSSIILIEAAAIMTRSF